MIANLKMHANEFETNVALVRALLDSQFPQWAHLSIQPVPSAGTDNALYRLGDDMVVRLPRVESAVGQVEKEWQWLPKLAPHLPLAIPLPLAQGNSAANFPWRWSIYRWLDGDNAADKKIADSPHTALALAQFIAALQRIDTTGGPPPGAHNSFRGEPLINRDAQTRETISHLRDVFDAEKMTAVWDAAIAAPIWNKPPVWIHGDLQAGNLLALRGKLYAVIDFGCLGIGDPACDVMTAWLYLSAKNRDLFRATLQVDDATWARARGWALTVGLIAFPYYQTTNPTLAEIARRAILEALSQYVTIFTRR